MTEYDPEKALWIPSRRRFFVMSGLALAGTVLGVKPEDPADVGLERLNRILDEWAKDAQTPVERLAHEIDARALRDVYRDVYGLKSPLTVSRIVRAELRWLTGPLQHVSAGPKP